MMTAAYDEGRRQQLPIMMAVVTYNDGRQRQQPTTVAAAAYIDGSTGGGRQEGGGAYARTGEG